MQEQLKIVGENTKILQMQVDGVLVLAENGGNSGYGGHSEFKGSNIF
jgi:hypothetical protein